MQAYKGEPIGVLSPRQVALMRATAAQRPEPPAAPLTGRALELHVEAFTSRYNTIMDLPEAKGREAQATYFCNETSMTVEQVKAALALAPAASASQPARAVAPYVAPAQPAPAPAPKAELRVDLVADMRRRFPPTETHAPNAAGAAPPLRADLAADMRARFPQSGEKPVEERTVARMRAMYPKGEN